MASTGRSVCSQQYPGRVEALGEEPPTRAGAQLFGEPPHQGPARQPGPFGEVSEGQLAAQPGRGPLQQWRQGLVHPDRRGRGGVLQLAALPVRRQDHVQGDLGSVFRAVVGTHIPMENAPDEIGRALGDFFGDDA